MSAAVMPGRRAARQLGWWRANRFLMLRRVTQAGVLGVFLAGPVVGLWIVKGTLASSLVLGMLWLSDPLVVLQSLAAWHRPEATALAGAAILAAGYLLLGGRVFCSWVCPINPLTDLIACLRRRLGIEKGRSLARGTRLWVLAMALVVSAGTGTIAWELVNPITIAWRAALYGPGLVLLVLGSILLLDLLVVRHGWCGHLCPVGAFYGLLGKAAVLRVSARGRARCDDCLDCFVVCPESQVIAPALRGAAAGRGPMILSGDCTNCARCVDVCPERVFALTHRFDRRVDPPRPPGRETPMEGRDG